MLDLLTLHIGHPKTGTTSLQATFRESAPVLAKHGVFYFAKTRNHHPIARQMHRRTRDRSERDAATFARFERELKNTSCPQAFVGSETLIRLTDEEARNAVAYFRRFAQNVHVLVYVRHPVGFASSAAHQGIRTGRDLAEIEAAPRVLPLRQLLKRWRDASGADRLIVRPFDRKLLVGGDVVDDALDVLGASAAAPQLNRLRINDPLSVLGAQILNRAQRVEPDRDLAIESLRAFDAIAGPRYILPKKAQEKVRRASADHLAFLEAEFGVVLPDVDDAPSPPSDLSPAELDSLATTLYRLTQYAYAVDQSPAARLFGMRSPFSRAWDVAPHPLANILRRVGITRRMIGRELRAERPILRPDAEDDASGG
ncbi:MAG: hypothetical protein AAGB11_13405 [Pseudomonadota bacterium]